MKKPLIILTGPTAVGKTKLSISLAKAVNGEIISADSMQVYKYMDIGSAKITPREMEGIPHYLIDEFEPEDEFSVVKFKELTNFYMEQIYDKGKIPIIVGGTGFYIQSVVYDINFTETKKDEGYRTELQNLAKEMGSEYLHQLLAQVDPKAANDIHANNTKRVIRALEYYKETGSRISEHNEEQSKKDSPYNFKYFVLNDDRAILYDRINKRVDLMIEKGLVKEVENLKNKGYTKDMVSMQGLGYKEILKHLEGEYSLEEAIYLIKRDTRHFAKRQLTWFKREKDVIWMERSQYDSDDELILESILDICKNDNVIE